MEKIVITPAEAASLLATSKLTIMELINRGEIPAYREGRNWKIPRSLLQKYAEDRAIREASMRKAAKD